jgi:hypothetical protein
VSSVNVKLGSTIGGSALYQVSFGAASWGATAAAPITPNPPIYTVSYEPNPGLVSGGGGSTNSTSQTGGTAHTIPTNGFTLPGYVFVSWNSRSDGSGVSYAPGSAITPSTNVALYAIWKSTSTTVTFFGNGATSGTVPAQATVAAGAQYTVAANTGGLSLAGNQFVGWNTTADGTGAFYLPGTLLNIPANTNLYAVWEPIPVVPPDAPINIDLEPGEPIAGAEVDYVIPNQPYDPSCDPTTDPSSAWSLTVKPIDPAGAAYEIDAGCTPPDGDVFGTAVLPQDVPGGIYEVVYQSASGEKIIRYFVVSPDGNFSGQTNVDPRIAKTGTESTVFLSPILVTSLSLALLALGTMLLTMRQLRTRLTH